jgi:ADP-dependent NAD(P)H-hydrate dehydratase / NAD(P)H-hydrate epimerase
MKLVTVDEMRAVEKEADSLGLTFQQMMENAGLGVAELTRENYGEGGVLQVTGLVGSGNNGGDTLVALAALAQIGWAATAYLVGPRSAEDNLVVGLKDAGGKIISSAEDEEMGQLAELLADTDVLLDGILGTGAKLPLKADLGKVLQKAQEFRPGFAVVAVDCPSGIDCDSGEAAPETLQADITACMAAVKTGLLKFPAFNLVGKIEVVGIGLPEDLPALQRIENEVVTSGDVRKSLPVRKADAHKGTFGTVMAVAGSINYTGAAFLAGKAAYRIGAGLVRMAVTGPVHAALAGHLPEVTWLLLPQEMGVISENGFEVLVKNLDKVTALLVGPGLGMEDTTAGFIKRLAGGKGVRAAKGRIGFVTSPSTSDSGATGPSLPPMVIDADGLKLLARVPNWPQLIPAPAVLTPHPGEMAILTGLSVEEIQKDRIEIARKYAREWGHVVVLKGAISVIAEPGGRLRVIPIASAALARAGTGDVLAGLITGLVAQGLSAFDAASAGAWIHAQAGLAAAEWIGSEAAVLASDVLDAVPEILEALVKVEN